MKKDKITMYIVAHKKYNKINNYSCYKTIKVGNNDFDYDYTDNIGDNIANKNKNYCELTALYWIWKNDKDSNIIGISHYRRYFSKNIFNKINNKAVNERDIFQILNKYDLIFPEPMNCKPKTVLEQYNNSHFKKDLLICGNIIKENCIEYYDAFNKVIKGHYYSQFNMLITSKEIFDKYCSWLFSILFEAEKQIDFKNYDDYNQRIFGFLSEILFNVWVEKNRYKYKELPVFNTNTSQNKIRSLLRWIKYKVDRKVCK